jgi:uncharacterized protein YecE (DUF72 family)
MKQLGLFGDPPANPLPHLEADRALAARLPPHIHLGPSSWTFPGWEGICYPPGLGREALVDRGLNHIARYPLFRTVGIDRSHYAPLHEADLRRYGSDLPAQFRCVMKVWNVITTYADPRTGARNPGFLDPGIFDEHVLYPVARAFADHAGPFVFQLAPIIKPDLPHPDEFADRLDRFFGGLSKEFHYAIEIRNRELFAPSYLEVLERHQVAHVLNLWERMPPIGQQLAMPGVLTAPFVVCRLSIGPGNRYQKRKQEFSPFNRLVVVDEAMRADVAALAEACGKLGKTLYVTVNNKVEGSSPLTIRALVERMVAEV